MRCVDFRFYEDIELGEIMGFDWWCWVVFQVVVNLVGLEGLERMRGWDVLLLDSVVAEIVVGLS